MLAPFGGAFMLVIITMCVSLMKALRAEPYESTLPARVRKAVLHVQEHELEAEHAIALTVLGADHEELLPGLEEDSDPTVSSRR